MIPNISSRSEGGGGDRNKLLSLEIYCDSLPLLRLLTPSYASPTQIPPYQFGIIPDVYLFCVLL